MLHKRCSINNLQSAHYQWEGREFRGGSDEKTRKMWLGRENVVVGISPVMRYPWNLIYMIIPFLFSFSQTLNPLFQTRKCFKMKRSISISFRTKGTCSILFKGTVSVISCNSPYKNGKNGNAILNFYI